MFKDPLITTCHLQKQEEQNNYATMRTFGIIIIICLIDFEFENLQEIALSIYSRFFD